MEHGPLQTCLIVFQESCQPTPLAEGVLAELENRFRPAFDALPADFWPKYGGRVVRMARKAGRIAAELADLDGSDQVTLVHALAGLRTMRDFCDLMLDRAGKDIVEIKGKTCQGVNLDP